MTNPLLPFLVVYLAPETSQMGLQPVAAESADLALILGGELLLRQGMGDALVMGCLDGAALKAAQESLAKVKLAINEAAL